jgi:hypothetical protein
VQHFGGEEEEAKELMVPIGDTEKALVIAINFQFFYSQCLAIESRRIRNSQRCDSAKGELDGY